MFNRPHVILCTEVVLRSVREQIIMGALLLESFCVHCEIGK